MTTIVTRAGKGSPLTNNEMDQNLINLNTAKIENTNTNTGSTPLASGTTAERDGTPASGYARFNEDTSKYEGYNGSSWVPLGGGATGGGSDEVFIENGQTVTTNYALSTNKNAISAGPITINSGVVVTVPSGQNWVVV